MAAFQAAHNGRIYIESSDVEEQISGIRKSKIANNKSNETITTRFLSAAPTESDIAKSF